MAWSNTVEAVQYCTQQYGTKQYSMNQYGMKQYVIKQYCVKEYCLKYCGEAVRYKAVHICSYSTSEIWLKIYPGNRYKSLKV